MKAEKLWQLPEKRRKKTGKQGQRNEVSLESISSNFEENSLKHKSQALRNHCQEEVAQVH